MSARLTPRGAEDDKEGKGQLVVGCRFLTLRSTARIGVAFVVVRCFGGREEERVHSAEITELGWTLDAAELHGNAGDEQYINKIQVTTETCQMLLRQSRMCP